MGPLQALAEQRGHLFAWVPVALSIGIGGYFLLPAEPTTAVYAVVAGVILALGAAGIALGERWAPVMALFVLVLTGFSLAGLRAHTKAAPVLEHRLFGAVEGRVLTVDRSRSDAARLTLEQVWIEELPAGETPHRVRISLFGAGGGAGISPGQWVGVTTHLSPPAPPSEPGGYDFRRRAWFERLGAVGYARSPAVVLGPRQDTRAAMWIHRIRLGLSARIRDRVPGEAGAFAAAILTGDRAAMPQDTLQTLRDSNLAHLLAISGLHMGLLTGFVFAALRYGLALIPPLALRVAVKKLAAGLALIAAAVYLALSGGNIATQRAFVMVAVMLIAVIFDRRAITLRGVAVAATIILCIAPESLLQAGFQMSFAATTALVAAFGVIRRLPPQFYPPPWLRGALALVVSSAVAGIATAPIGAAHFNQIAQYGLMANLLTVPLMGALVIPAAVLAGALAPLGLEALGLAVMHGAINWILGVARWVAGLEGAVWPVPVPGQWVLPLLALGMLLVILWQGRARFAGVVPVVAALLLWTQSARPELLIAESGRLAGIMTDGGRALNKPKGDGFAARIWLENDGERVSQAEAAARAGFSGEAGLWRVEAAGLRFTFLQGRGWEQRLDQACHEGWLVVPYRVTQPPQGDCTLLDQRRLRETGALAIYATAKGPRLVSAAERAGRRLWVQ